MKVFNAEAIAALDLTEPEKNVLKALISGLYAEPGFSDVIVQELATSANLSNQAAGGVVSSLVKKGYCWVSEAEFFRGKMEIPPIVYLCNTYWHLVPEWANG